MPAYDPLYYSDSITLAEQIFYEVAKDGKWDFDKFIIGFMGCKFRRLWDKGSPRIINMTWDELLEYLECDVPYIFVSGECIVDPLLAEWLGGMYTRVQFHSGKSSQEIYEKLPLNRMLQLFQPLHTIDEEVAAEKLLSWL